MIFRKKKVTVVVQSLFAILASRKKKAPHEVIQEQSEMVWMCGS